MFTLCDTLFPSTTLVRSAVWRVAVLAGRRARPKRSSVDAGADHGGPGRRKAAGPTRWTTADDRRGKDAVDSCCSVQWGQQSVGFRSEEHTSALQSLMRNLYAVFYLKKNNYKTTIDQSKSTIQ